MAQKLISVIVLALTMSTNANAIQYSDKEGTKQPTVRAENAPVAEYKLTDYVGNYSTDKMPLKINVFIKDDLLMAQATGQGAFPLTATAKNQFSFAPAGIEMRFDIEKGTFNLHQAGAVFLFTKE